MKWIHIAVLYVAAILIFGCLLFSINKAKNNPVEKVLKKLLLSACASVAAYATAMLLPNQFLSEACYGVYYIFLDAIVMAMVSFVRRYAGLVPKLKKEGSIIGVAISIDTLLIALNPITHWYFSVGNLGEGESAFYTINERGEGFIYHFVLLCLLMALSMLRLIWKTRTSPKVYKGKYAAIFVMLAIAFSAHILYINLDFKFDYSLFLYGLIAIGVYYFSVSYIPQGLTERLMFLTIESFKDGVICVDMDGNIVYSNNKAREYFSDEYIDNCKIMEVINRWFSQHPEAKENDVIWETQRHIIGEKKFFKNSYTRIIDENEKYLGCFFIMHDCSKEFKRIEEEQYRATHDALTGLYNMDFFCERAAILMDENPNDEYVIICTDVKSFKVINDMFGVEIGDKLRIIPVHICPVCNLYDEAYLVSGDEVVEILKVAGRGKIQ